MAWVKALRPPPPPLLLLLPFLLAVTRDKVKISRAARGLALSRGWIRKEGPFFNDIPLLSGKRSRRNTRGGSFLCVHKIFISAPRLDSRQKEDLRLSWWSRKETWPAKIRWRRGVSSTWTFFRPWKMNNVVKAWKIAFEIITLDWRNWLIVQSSYLSLKANLSI